MWKFSPTHQKPVFQAMILILFFWANLPVKHQSRRRVSAEDTPYPVGGWLPQPWKQGHSGHPGGASDGCSGSSGLWGWPCYLCCCLLIPGPIRDEEGNICVILHSSLLVVVCICNNYQSHAFICISCCIVKSFHQREKNLGSRVALLPGKFFPTGKFFKNTQKNICH